MRKGCFVVFKELYPYLLFVPFLKEKNSGMKTDPWCDMEDTGEKIAL